MFRDLVTAARAVDQRYLEDALYLSRSVLLLKKHYDAEKKAPKNYTNTLNM